MSNPLGCNGFQHRCGGPSAHTIQGHTAQTDPFAATIAQAQADRDEITAWADRHARTSWERDVLVRGVEAIAHRDGLPPDAIRQILCPPRSGILAALPAPDAGLGAPTIESVGPDGSVTLLWRGWGDPNRREAYRRTLSVWLGNLLSWLDGLVTGVR